jgi:hypothetical protein
MVHEWTLETACHDCGTLRVRIVNDPEPYDCGDLFTRAGTAGTPEFDALTDAELAEREAAFLRELYENGGPWGFIVERKCPTCGKWEEIDSLWGIDGSDTSYALSEGIASMNYHHDNPAPCPHTAPTFGALVRAHAGADTPSDGITHD